MFKLNNNWYFAWQICKYTPVERVGHKFYSRENLWALLRDREYSHLWHILITLTSASWLYGKTAILHLTLSQRNYSGSPVCEQQQHNVAIWILLEHEINLRQMSNNWMKNYLQSDKIIRKKIRNCTLIHLQHVKYKLEELLKIF